MTSACFCIFPIGQLRLHILRQIEPVWPDWTIFESSRWQIFLQKEPKSNYVDFLGNFWKNWATFYSSHTGHTELYSRDQVKAKEVVDGKRELVVVGIGRGDVRKRCRKCPLFRRVNARQRCRELNIQIEAVNGRWRPRGCSNPCPQNGRRFDRWLFKNIFKHLWSIFL